jgi:riboflavin kinase / FMN adenylyltransferase
VLIINDLSKIPELTRNSVVTMGDFDGVHTGHQVLIDNTIERARKNNCESILITYEPSPKKILKKLAVDSRLTTYQEKTEILRSTGLSMVIFYPMTSATLKISARSFLRDFLLSRLHMRDLIMGNDHHFGHNRRGNAAYLKAASVRYGFAIEIIAEQLTQSHRTSSSRMRAALAKGDIEIVSEILGRQYCISGKVIHGEQRGTALGFPTANLEIDPEKLLPAPGVYFGRVALPDGRQFYGVANLGTKPTVGNFSLGLEIHILDFTENLYGEQIRFYLGGRLRSEKAFSGIEALKIQIAADITATRQKIVSQI